MKSEVVFALENAAWPALLVTAMGQVLMSNAAARTFFGEALEAESPNLAPFWSPKNETQFAGYLAWWENSKPSPVELTFRSAGCVDKRFSVPIAVLANQDGKWFLLQLLPLPELASKPLEMATEFRNATGDAALKQKLDCVLQLARTVSLDFNNALTGVLAHTSLLLGKAEPHHPWRSSLLEVEKSAARAAEIATELALFSRQEKVAPRTPAGNLNAVTNRCVEVFRNNHGAPLTWQFTMERSLFEARYDEAKIQQALTKIFENAVEAFAPQAPGQISVTTRNVDLKEPTKDGNVQLAPGLYICVEVADNGCGIETASLSRVFEPFFTTKTPPHRGLGLALVYGIITNHGGGIAISSQPGNGTSARLYLPAENTFVADVGPGDQELYGMETILVVDDEPLMLTMAVAILTEFGYRVITTSNGQSALQQLENPANPIDLVITDLVMPGMGGRELMERIRQMGLEIPIVTTSGYVLPEEKQALAGYLQKPFTTIDLLRKVKAALASQPPQP